MGMDDEEAFAGLLGDESAGKPKLRRTKQDTQDITADWKLAKKDFSEEAVLRSQGMLSSLTMSMSLRLKVLESISLYRVDIDAKAQPAVLAKSRTSTYHLNNKSMQKSDRRQKFPPFVLVVEATLDTTKQLIIDETLPDQHPLVVAYTGYTMDTDGLEVEAKIKFLLQDWRFMRYRTTWNKQRLMCEIGLAPLASSKAQALCRAWLQMLCSYYDGTQKHGIAPKSQIEQRLENILRKMNIWKQRGD
jgi:hypothetical protein